MQDKKISNKLVLSNGVIAFFLTIVLSAFFFYEIGNRHFADPDEGRYVEIPREMVVSGDFITPRLNGLKYFEKPPLFYWMQAGMIKIFGINETSMRLWLTIFSVFGCLCVFFVGSECYSNAVGLISSIILATNILYYMHSKLIVLDLVMSVLMSGTMWCFFLAFVKKRKNFQKFLIIGMYIFAALSCLVKGLIGAFLPAIVVFLWITFTKNWSKIKDILYVPGILIFLVIFLPWHILVSMRNDDFLHFYFVVEHFLRYTTTAHKRYQPFWFFLPVLLTGLFPWTGFSLIAIKNSIRKALLFKKQHSYEDNVFFTCWIFVIFVFFSFSNSKNISYILPIFPAIALITGITIFESFRDYKIGVWLNISFFCILLVMYEFIAKPRITDILQNSNASFFVTFFICLLIFAIIVLLFSLKIKRIAAVLSHVFVCASMMLVVNKVSVFYQETKRPTTKHFAELVNLNRTKDDLVICYNRYYQDFPVYLNSTVKVVDFIGELKFGAKADKNNDVLISEEKFWDMWKATNKRIFLLLSQKDYKKHFLTKNMVYNVLDSNKYFLVIKNK